MRGFRDWKSGHPLLLMTMAQLSSAQLSSAQLSSAKHSQVFVLRQDPGTLSVVAHIRIQGMHANDISSPVSTRRKEAVDSICIKWRCLPFHSPATENKDLSKTRVALATV